MLRFIDSPAFSGFCERALAVLADSAAKGVILLVLAWLIAICLRRSSAAARHLVWALALGGLLLLPALSLVLPKWQLPILPQTPLLALPAPAVTAQSLPVVPQVAVPEAMMPVSQEPAYPAVSLDKPTPTPAPAKFSVQSLPLGFWLIAVWLMVALMALVPLCAGFVFLGRLIRRAEPLDHDPWPALLRLLSERLGLRRSVRVLRTNGSTMPMAVGVWQPTVLLPAEAEAWSDEKRRAVLLHELAHIRRWDCLTHILTRLACVVHWFNPLAWLVLKKLQNERERACDDLVLTAGARPAAYADQLLDIARTICAGTAASTAAIPMARQSQLEGRLLAILDDKASRRHVTRRALLAACGLSVLLLGALATMGVSSAQPSKSANARAARQTVEFFIESFGKKDINTAATVVIEPLRQLMKTDAPDQPEEVFKAMSRAKIEEVLVKHETARVLAGPILRPNDKDPNYALFVLVHQDGRWLIEDIADMSLDSARAKLIAFKATTGFVTEPCPSLEFRLVPAASSPALSPEAIDRYTRQLTAEGPNAGRKDGADYAWFESLIVPPPGTVSTKFRERTYILLANRPDAMMDSRTGDWTLTRLCETRSAGIAGGVKLTFDERGAARYRQFAIARPGTRIAALIDGQVVSLTLGTAVGLDGHDLQLSGGPNGWDNPLRMRLLLRLAELFPEAPGTFIVKQGWDGKTLDVPFPLVVPQWLRETPDWKEWERRKNIRTFDARDRLGRRYFIEAAGWSGDGFGHAYPMMPRVERYRPDGTLESQSAHLHGTYPVGVIPDNNYFYAADGKTKTGSLWIRGEGAPGWPFVYGFNAPAADGKVHKYSCTQYGVVRMEQLAELDAQGVFQDGALVNAIRNDEDARFEADVPRVTAVNKAMKNPLTIKVAEDAGKPIADAEIHLHKIGSNSFGLKWKDAGLGTVSYTAAELTNDSGGKAEGKYLVSVRARGYAPRLLKVDVPKEGGITTAVTMTKGKTIELTLRDRAGRSIPESLDPAVFYPEQATHAWYFLKTESSQPWGSSKMSVCPMEKMGAGRYRFQWDETAPEFYILISEPGFIRGLQAGPFSREQWASGKIEIELPVPGLLAASVHAPAGFTGANPTKACSFNIGQILKMPKKANGGEDYTMGAGVQYWYKIQDGIQTSVTLNDLPPGQYNISGQSRAPRKDLPNYIDIAWEGNKQVEIQSGKTATVDFVYKIEDDSKTKGQYTAVVKVQRQDGTPASGIPFKLTYNEPGFISKTLGEGKTSATGEFELAGLAGGANAPGYDLELAGINIGAVQLMGDQKRQEFKFIMPPLAGDPAPEISLYDVQTGKMIRLSEFKGQTVLLDFWATWCGPCQKPMITMNELAGKHKADWAGKAILLAASIDDDLVTLSGHIAKNNFQQVNQAWCKSERTGWNADAAKAFGIHAVPTTFLIDATGKIVFRGNPNEFDVEDLIAKHLKGNANIAPASRAATTTATLDTRPDALKKALAALEKEKSIGALRQLLKINGQDPTPADQVGADDQSLASAMNIGTEGVRRITCGSEDFIVVHARSIMAVPQKFRAQLPNGLGMALYFNQYGNFIGKVGGEAGSDPDDPIAWTTDVLTSSLGTTDHWFTWVTRQDKRNGFNYCIDLYMLNPLKMELTLALRLHSISCSMSFSNTPDVVVDGHTSYLAPANNSGAGLDVSPQTSGLGQDNKPHHPVIGWDAANGLFRGPSRFTYGDKAIYEVDQKASPRFLATDLPEPVFEKLYSLAPGEMLRRVGPPFISGRLEYIRNYDKKLFGHDNGTPSSVQFLWDGKLGVGCMTYSESELGKELSGIFSNILELKSYEVEGPESLLATRVPGDWIVRRDATPEQRVKTLERILNEQLGMGLRIEKRRVEREVIVARGQFVFTPLPVNSDPSDKDRVIHLYTDVLNPSQYMSDQGGNTVGEFLQSLGDNLNMPVINESGSAGFTHSMRWRSYHMPPQSDSAAVDRLLQNVTKQTALQFKRERRPVDIWFISRQ